MAVTPGNTFFLDQPDDPEYDFSDLYQDFVCGVCGTSEPLATMLCKQCGKPFHDTCGTTLDLADGIIRLCDVCMPMG